MDQSDATRAGIFSRWTNRTQVLQSALGSVGDMQLYETQEAVKEPAGCTITTVVVPEVGHSDCPPCSP